MPCHPRSHHYHKGTILASFLPVQGHFHHGGTEDTEEELHREREYQFFLRSREYRIGEKGLRPERGYNIQKRCLRSHLQRIEVGGPAQRALRQPITARPRKQKLISHRAQTISMSLTEPQNSQRGCLFFWRERTRQKKNSSSARQWTFHEVARFWSDSPLKKSDQSLLVPSVSSSEAG